ncbi:MAG: hypothetical protein HY290_00140 [Planctomycetia bacterium]|nr:hypothetical protein [Planctomycetia bacterium]
MRFALLGSGPAALAVARAVSRHAAHRLVRLAGPAAEGPGRVAALRACRGWEELLSDAEVDAVIFGETDDDWQPAVRQLLQAGKTVLALPQLVQATSFFYELALFDAESPGRLFPLLALRGHPLVAELAQWIAGGRLGRIRHIQVERTITAPQVDGGTAGFMSPTDVAAALLIDVDLLRLLVGPYDQVAASRSGESGAGYSLATATFGGKSAPQAVWTAVGSASESGWKLTLLGDAGTAVLDGRPLEGQLRLTINLPQQSPNVSEATADSGDWLLERFDAELDRNSNRSGSAQNRSGIRENSGSNVTSLWNEMACAVELVDAVERSVRRRRTIDVYFETPSERGLFKSQMTAVGCSLLMLTLVAIVLYLVLEASIVLPQLVRQVLVVLIFIPLGIFLLMQALLFIARPPSHEEP